MKNIGKPCAGKPHARFDEGGQVTACFLLYPIIAIIEDQPRWLAFLGAEQDLIRPIPPPLADAALPGGKLAPNLVRAGINRTADEVAWLTYTTFNMKIIIIL